MRKRYDAVVVGSGFGGAVAACRLAQAGLRVGIIERGRRYALGTFPRDFRDPRNGWLWEHEQGLFDVRPVNEMTIVQSAAYGGGSHIYANVHLRVPPHVFQRDWPTGYTRAALDPHYDLVAYMLDIKPIQANQPLGMPPKTLQMRTVAERLGRADQFCYPNLALDFGPPERLHKNKFGVDQEGCRHCGECDIGCNYQAKNTVDLNYLALAERHGADVATRCEVQRIVPRAGDGYQVHFRDHAAGLDQQIDAAKVFLCGGAVNTTELLLRCRDQYRTLPKLSARLGHGYSGNGDFLAFAFHTKEPFEPWVGPTITTGIVYDRGEREGGQWFIFQEGGYPRQIANLLQVLSPHDPRFAAPLRVWDELHQEIRRAAAAEMGERGGVTQAGMAGKNEEARQVGDDTAVFLAMGRDRADGLIELLPGTYQMRVKWELPKNLPLYDTEERFCFDVAEALGGELVLNPLWQHLRLPVSVHNLGGCTMADGPSTGVTDGDGEVFGYPGLYVLDGACLPSATGVNPSHTIAAVAERNIETAIRKITGQERWSAPERRLAKPVHDPVSALIIPPGGTAPTRTPAIGLRFTETMRGYLQRGAKPEDDYLGAEEAGRRAGTAIRFTLTIATAFLDEFLASEAHPAAAAGTLHADGFTGPEGARVSNGVVNLLSPSDTPTARRMVYTLPFFGVGGRPYLLDGYKDVRDHGHFDVWGSTTTLYTVIRAGHSRAGRVLATGILHILAPDFLQQLTTVRITGTNNPLRQAAALVRFEQMFLGSLWDVFVRPRIPELTK